MDSNCSNLLYLRNLQEQVKKAFCYQKLFWPFTVWTNCSSDLKIFANSQPSVSNFNFFSRSQEQFFLTVGQNNFGNKIPFGKFVKYLLPLFFVHAVDKMEERCVWEATTNVQSNAIPTVRPTYIPLARAQYFDLMFKWKFCVHTILLFKFLNNCFWYFKYY